jgi:MFS superfamily sulfate permease-like transporter
MIGSFFQAYPVTGSFSRSAVNASCYVQTLIGGVIAGLVVIFAFEELTKALFYVPQACLSAVVMVAVMSIIDYKVGLRWRLDER